MGIQSFPSSGVKFDKTAMTPINNPINNVLSATTSYQTVYSYTGKGYLDYIFVDSNSTYAVCLKITVDGAVKFEGWVDDTVGLKGMAGIINRQMIEVSYDGSAYGSFIPVMASVSGVNVFPYRINNASIVPVDLPYSGGNTNTSKGAASFINDSIYFFSSILIEIKSETAITAPYYFAGGKI